MDKWFACRITLTVSGSTKVARVYIQDIAGTLEPKMRVVLSVRHPNGSVIQVAGAVERVLKRTKNSRYVSVLIPWQVAMTLARQVGVAVENGKRTELYDYTAKIEGVSLPPLS
jgi:predicted aminopeptidase